MKKKKSVEFNFGTFLIILIILLGAVFFIARNTGKAGENVGNLEQNTVTQNEQKDYEENLFSKDVVTIDIGMLNQNWEVKDEAYGSIIFYIQGPKTENEDGTVNDVRINIYIEESSMTNEELKTQMLENSIYQEIEYTKMQQINSIQWMEFEAKNKGVKAKILTVMIDGYMYAAEISGEENTYDENYNDAMKAVMTLKIADRIPEDTASTVIYNYDNLANIKLGGTQYLLTSLNLPQTMEQTEENTTLPEEYKDYIWTGINYNDFANKMKEYMTEEVLNTQFSEFINYKDCLYVKDVTGEQIDYMIDEINPVETKGNETTYEVSKVITSTFITEVQKITLKYENGNCVVSNVE